MSYKFGLANGIVCVCYFMIVVCNIYIYIYIYIYVYKHFNDNEHTFSKHGKFIILEQLQTISSTPTETLKLRLKERENFWIKKLKTLRPCGLNQEPN